MKTETGTIYVCNYCGSRYADIKDAELCELKCSWNINSTFEVGDIVTVKPENKTGIVQARNNIEGEWLYSVEYFNGYHKVLKGFTVDKIDLKYRTEVIPVAEKYLKEKYGTEDIVFDTYDFKFIATVTEDVDTVIKNLTIKGEQNETQPEGQ